MLEADGFDVREPPNGRKIGHQDHVVLDIHFHNFQISYRDAIGAHVAENGTSVAPDATLIASHSPTEDGGSRVSSA